MLTLPVAPDTAAPEYSTAAPLAPTDSVSDDRIAIRPDDEDAPPPDTTLTLPPDAVVDVVAPAPTYTLPPAPEVAEPVLSTSWPLLPADDAPE